MIEWNFENKNIINPKAKVEQVLDILKMRKHYEQEAALIYEEHDEFDLEEFIITFNKIWDDWLEKCESDEVFKFGNNIFNPIALGLVRRTFPALFANKIVGVQAMKTPVGLASAMRVIYNDNSNP